MEGIPTPGQESYGASDYTTALGVRALSMVQSAQCPAKTSNGKLMWRVTLNGSKSILRIDPPLLPLLEGNQKEILLEREVQNLSWWLYSYGSVMGTHTSTGGK